MRKRTRIFFTSSDSQHLEINLPSKKFRHRTRKIADGKSALNVNGSSDCGKNYSHSTTFGHGFLISVGFLCQKKMPSQLPPRGQQNLIGFSEVSPSKLLDSRRFRWWFLRDHTDLETGGYPKHPSFSEQKKLVGVRSPK